MARRCGAKHICKAKCTKHRMLGPILYVLMFKKWHATVAQSTFSTQNAQNTARSDQFDPQKLHAAVARSTCVSQNAQNTTLSGHFLKFRCSKMARRWGTKYICKSKCAKHHTLAPLFEVPMFKNGTPLWRKAHLQVKMYKTPAFCSILRGF